MHSEITKEEIIIAVLVLGVFTSDNLLQVNDGAELISVPLGIGFF